MENGERSIKVLMLPWLAHGHVSPFLELAKRLSRRNFYVYFCSTPANLVSIKDKVPQKYAKSIQLVELHLPSFPELPPHYHTTKSLPPSLMPALKRAFDLSSPNFSKILETLSPDLLIYDFLQPWAPDVALSLNIPAVVFFTTGASLSAFVTHLSNNPEAEFPFPAIYLRDHEKTNFNQLLQVSANDQVSSWQRTEQCYKLSSGIILIKTFKGIEDKYITYLSRLYDKKVVPVGPLVEDQAPDEGDGDRDQG